MADQAALVVVSYGSHELLSRHLVRTAAGCDALVVVVDNFSTDREVAAVRRLTEERGWELVAQPNHGFGSGVDAGARRAIELGCDVLVVLNPDLAVDGATVQALVDAVRAERSTVVTPRIVRPDGSTWFAGGSLDLATGRTRASGTGQAEPAWLSGACLALGREMWERVGGFDEDFFLYWEDVELSWRLRQAGARLRVLSHLTATHDVGGTQRSGPSRAKSSAYYRHNCRGRLLFAAKHLDASGARRWALSAPAYAREVVLRGGRRQLLRSPAPVVAALRGTVEGLAALRRARQGLAAGRGTTPVPSGGPGDPGSPVPHPRRLLVAHPSPDVYGSDRQLLETTGGALDAGWEVEVVVPHEGPLLPLLREQGATVRVLAFPVLRKAVLHPVRLPAFAVSLVVASWRLARALRRRRVDVLYVNTVTIPVWLVAARLARVPVLCHVHEAEEDAPRLLSAAITAPLLLADRVLTNSRAASAALGRVAPRLAARAVVVHNGVPGPDEEPQVRVPPAGEPWQLALVGRLSPRKGVDVALEAVALLAAQGRDVRLTVCGTIFPGYEWYEEQLRTRAAEPDLRGLVDLRGYVHPTWPVLAAADVVLVPSRTEPFGNTAVEGLLARRPVVASGVQGLAEVLVPERTGLLVPPGDAAALAQAVARLIDDDDLRLRLSLDGRADALERFTTERYRADVVAQLEALRAGDRRAAAARPHAPRATR